MLLIRLLKTSGSSFGRCCRWRVFRRARIRLFPPEPAHLTSKYVKIKLKDSLETTQWVNSVVSPDTVRATEKLQDKAGHMFKKVTYSLSNLTYIQVSGEKTGQTQNCHITQKSQNYHMTGVVQNSCIWLFAYLRTISTEHISHVVWTSALICVHPCCCWPAACAVGGSVCWTDTLLVALKYCLFVFGLEKAQTTYSQECLFISTWQLYDQHFDYIA